MEEQLLVQCGMKAGDTIEFEVLARLQYLCVLATCISRVLEQQPLFHERQDIVEHVELATHELCTNIVKHAYAGAGGYISISLTIWQSPPVIVIELCDDGCSFDPSQVPEPAPLAEHGRGLKLACDLMHEITYYGRDGRGWYSTAQKHWQVLNGAHPQPGKNYWRLVKKA